MGVLVPEARLVPRWFCSEVSSEERYRPGIRATDGDSRRHALPVEWYRVQRREPWMTFKAGSPTRTRTSNLAVNSRLRRTRSTSEILSKPCSSLPRLKSSFTTHRFRSRAETLNQNHFPRASPSRVAGLPSLMLGQASREILRRADIQATSGNRSQYVCTVHGRSSSQNKSRRATRPAALAHAWLPDEDSNLEPSG